MSNINLATTVSDKPIDRVLGGLENVRQKGDQYRAKCPVHQKPESRKQTLSIKENPDGQVMIHCFAGCHYEEVLDAIGLKKCDLFPDPDWFYEKEPNYKSLRQVIDDCKPTATLLQVYVAEMMRPKAWEVIAGTLHLDKRDLWILKGAADSLREVLDA
jgi:hypothetical protein